MNVAIFVATAVVLFGAIFGVVSYLSRRSKVKAQVSEGPDRVNVLMALNIIWEQTFKMDRKLLPRIDWVTGKRLNCHNGTGWFDANGQCVAGASWQDQYASAVAWVPGELLSDTALAHELTHVLTWHKGGLDPDHEGPLFSPGGLKDQAVEALRAAGL